MRQFNVIIVVVGICSFLPCIIYTRAVASLGLESPGVATDGVTYFFSTQKLTTFLVITLYEVMTFFTIVWSQLPSPTFRRRLSSVLCKFIHKNVISFGCHSS